MAEKKNAEAEVEHTEVQPRESKATALEPAEPVEVPAVYGATFAERAKARKQADSKAVSGDDAENKSVSSKRTAKK